METLQLINARAQASRGTRIGKPGCGAFVVDVTSYRADKVSADRVGATATVNCDHEDCPIRTKGIAEGRMPSPESALGTVFGGGDTPKEATDNALSTTDHVIRECNR